MSSKITFFILFFFINLCGAYAQKHKLDSLLTAIKIENTDTNKANAYMDIAKIYSKNQPRLGLQYIDSAIVIGGQKKYEKGIAQYYNVKAFLFNSLALHDSAIAWYKKTLWQYQKILKLLKQPSDKDKENIAHCLYRIGIVNFHKSAYDSAIYYYSLALPVFKLTNNKKQMAMIYKNSGAAYQMIGNYQQALNRYHAALKISEELREVRQITDCYNNIGIINTELGHYDKAAEYLNKCAALSIEQKDYESAAYAYSNIGNIAMAKKEYNLALDKYKNALHIYLQFQNKRQVANSYANISNVYIMQDKNAEAIAYYEKAIQMYEQLNDKMGMVYAYQSISQLYLNIKNYQKANEYSQKTLTIAKESNMLPLQSAAYAALSAAHENLNQYAAALKYYKEHVSIKDSIFNSEKHKQIAEMQTKYETEKMASEKNIIQKEKEILHLQYTRQKTFTYSLIAGIVFLTLFSGIIYLQKRKQITTNKILTRKNIEIVESEKELRSQQDELKAIIEILQEKNQQIPEEIIQQSSKYATSKLNETEQQALIHKIEVLFKEKKIFLQSDLTLDKLAKKLNTNRSYISQVINDAYNQNFNNFLNEFRIKEACILLADPRYKHLSIEGISAEVGFNSIATFNRCFKKFTGENPSAYSAQFMRI